MFMLNSVYEKEYDPDTDRWFYVNKVRHTSLYYLCVVFQRNSQLGAPINCGVPRT